MLSQADAWAVSGTETARMVACEDITDQQGAGAPLGSQERNPIGVFSFKMVKYAKTAWTLARNSDESISPTAERGNLHSLTSAPVCCS